MLPRSLPTAITLNSPDGKITPTRSWTLRLYEYYEKNKEKQVSEGGKGPNGEVLEGILLPTAISPQEILDLKQNLVPRSDDVFIVTYPKCGTTWLQQIVKLIWNNGFEDGRDIDEALPWVDAMKPAETEVLPSPRGFKTHLPYHLCPGGEPFKSPAKYIYVYRNPKDAMVSNYHFSIKYFPEDAPWDDYFKMLMDGNVYFGNIVDHYRGWLVHRDTPNIFVVSYESLKREPSKLINKIAKFLGYDLTEDAIARIVEATSFDKMKENPSANNSWMNEYRREGAPFMRKGIIGDWKNLFSKDQSAQVDEMIAEKLQDVNVTFDFGD